MSGKKECNICFAATSDFLPNAVVTSLSVVENLSKEYHLNVFFLYADIVKDISDYERNTLFEYANPTFEENNISIYYHDVKNLMRAFDGQNIGMWGKNISMTHYIYLLTPTVLKTIDKVIYLDTDMIVNTDLADVFNIDLGDYLLAMGAPRGYEEMGDDVANSGFVYLNLKQWRKESTLNTLLKFGKTLPKKNFCDQYLLHEYFMKQHNDRLMLLDKEYNIFPQTMPSLPLDTIKIMHFTGYEHIKPWNDINGKQRGGEYFWKYARRTQFYEFFLLKNLNSVHNSIVYSLQQRDIILENVLEKNNKDMISVMENKFNTIITRNAQTFALLKKEIDSLKQRIAEL